MRRARGCNVFKDGEHGVEIVDATGGTGSDEIVRIPAWWMLLPIPMEVLYVFEAGQIDPEALKASLSKVLGVYPALAGRLLPGGEVIFDEELQALTGGVRLNNHGVPFRVVKSPKTTKTVLNWEDSPKSFVHSDRPNIRQVLKGEEAFITVKLTQCSDGGCILGVTLNHLLCDGWTMSNFLHDWSELHNGREVAPVSFEFIPESCKKLPERLADQMRNKFGGARTNKLTAAGAFMTAMMQKGKRSVLHFSDAELKLIKEQAEATSQGRVSSNEALASHVHSLLREELGAPESQPLQAQFAINLRGKLPEIPQRCIGNYMVMPKVTSPGSDPASVHATFRAALSEEALRADPQLSQSFIARFVSGGDCSVAPRFSEVHSVPEWNNQLGSPYVDVDFGFGPPDRMVTWGGEGMKIQRAVPKLGGLDVCISHLVFKHDPSLTLDQRQHFNRAMKRLRQNPKLHPSKTRKL